MEVDAAEKPLVRCLVSYPVEDELTILACVSLDTAAYLKGRGWLVVGPDPHDIIALQEFERARRWLQVWPNNDRARPRSQR
jgi:hypothetical protein